MAEFSSLNGYVVKDKKAIRYYDSVNTMKSDTTLKNGMFAKTLGYYTENDGGQAEYIIVDDNNLIEDSGNIHALKNGLFAKLIKKDTINLRQFGAYGDKTHDDYNALNNAINYCKNNNTKLYIPIGEFLIGNNITIDFPLNVYGTFSCNNSGLINSNKKSII